jgi:hypothetical protein
MIHHPPESTDWLNVLLAQAILQYREDAKINDRLMRAVDDILNGGVKSNFLVRTHHVEKDKDGNADLCCVFFLLMLGSYSCYGIEFRRAISHI